MNNWTFVTILVAALIGAFALTAAYASPEPTERVVCHANEDQQQLAPQVGDYGTVTRQRCYFGDFAGAEVEVLFID